MQGDRVAALLRRLAASDAPPEDVSPTRSWTLLTLGRPAMVIPTLLHSLEKRQAREAHLSSEQLASLLAWPAAVVATTPVVLPSAARAVHGQLCNVTMSVAIDHFYFLATCNAESAVLAAARAEVQQQLPALVRACARAAGCLAMPGEALPVHTACRGAGGGFCEAVCAVVLAAPPGERKVLRPSMPDAPPPGTPPMLRR